MMRASLLVCLCLQAYVIDASHFRGGAVVWRPMNTTASGSTVDIQVRERFSWRLSFFVCNAATVAALTPLIGDAATLNCVSGNCSGWSNVSTQTPCTDFSAALDVASGERYYTKTVLLNAQFSVAFAACCWFANLVVGGNGAWSVVTRINTMLRPDGYINSSPIPVSLPVIYKAIYIQNVHPVQRVDFDGSDILKCRWSTTSGNTNSYDEAGSVAMAVPGATLDTNNCTLTFTLTQASFYVAVALQIEDYYNSASTTPMSSVPLQFLFYGYNVTSGCTTPPMIIGVRPNLACISTPIGASVSDSIIVQVLCPGKSIVDIVSVSPIGMTKGNITNPSAGIYQISISWTPTAAQFGPQGLCVGAVDNTNIQSNQWCITYLVGVDAPALIAGSAAPVGVIPANETVFEIQANKPVFQPSRNGSYIYFTDATTNTLVQRFDCGWAPEVSYANRSVVIRFPFAPWITGHSYYVTFDSGVASGGESCHPESAPVTSSSFWTFTIALPFSNTTTTVAANVSSTTTTTTRRATTSSALTTWSASKFWQGALLAQMAAIGLMYY